MIHEFIALLTTFGIVFIVVIAIGVPVWLFERKSAVWESVSVAAMPKPTGFLWWLRNGDSWHAPEMNNGEAYLPEVKNQWLRDFYWFWRNPLGNFMGFVVGVEGYDYVASGTAPVLATTGRDVSPQQMGWRWAVLKVGRWVRLPYVSYWNGRVEFYLGWRPASGGLGLKILVTKKSS